MGLPEGTCYKIVPSPFNYNQNATFEVPQGAADPRDADQFTQVLVGQLNKIIEHKKATLVILQPDSKCMPSSRNWMNHSQAIGDYAG